MPKYLIITVARKPLSEGNVASNVLKWGSGTLNIDLCRIGTTKRAPHSPRKGTDDIYGAYGKQDMGMSGFNTNIGRWPANLVLSSPAAAELDIQSGKLHARGNLGTSKGGGGMYGHRQTTNTFGAGDAGGASRFFKHIQEFTNMSTPIPQEFLDYLISLISPPGLPALFFDGLENKKLHEIEDSSIPGLIVRGTPTEEESKELMRILFPGAHLLLLAPDEQPTGHTGTCRIEDAGFEIRDSVLWVREAGVVQYVPKASRRERNAGVNGSGKFLWFYKEAPEEDLEILRVFLAEEGFTDDHIEQILEGNLGIKDPGPWKPNFEHKKDDQGNQHPTVKPIAIMEALLEDVPTDEGPVVDPFFGSGTTGIGGLRKGHSVIGIEKDRESLETADKRIRYWDQAESGWTGADIESDVAPEMKEEEAVDIGDIFGF